MINNKIHLTYQKQLKKLTHWTQKQLKSTPREKTVSSPIPSFYDKVVNNTNVEFNDTEIKMLDIGLKYCPNLPLHLKDLENLAIDTDIATSDYGNKYLCTKIIKNATTEGKFSSEAHTVKSIKNKINQNNLIISKADKGNSTVRPVSERLI